MSFSLEIPSHFRCKLIGFSPGRGNPLGVNFGWSLIKIEKRGENVKKKKIRLTLSQIEMVVGVFNNRHKTKTKNILSKE